ncbi:hypothetical protein [uncultured Flavobacterium sp.]|uniref:hypothetical protein n=1 Tax=uncultured Flavobacterium sp. TaxID=165435 RepID=UPI0030C8621A
MNTILKNILAVIAGWLIGSTVNMLLIKIGSSIFPIKGVDSNDMEALADIMPNLSSEYFIFPFLGHAFGSLVGALIVTLIATNHKMKLALVIGVLFLVGGIDVNYMLPGPIWFTIADITLAYIPMAYIGGKLGIRIVKK